MESPLIITVRLDDESFNFFDSLRKRFFPPNKNFLAAHLTLFHHLPSNESAVKDDLLNWSMPQQKIPLPVTAVKNIGKGVVYKIDCPELVALHTKMRNKWQQWLQPQDKQKIWPHITIQNKVMPAEARQTMELLQKTFSAFNSLACGFDLWSYEGGPWKFIHTFPFQLQ